MDVEGIKRKYRRNAIFYNLVDRPLRRVRGRVRRWHSARMIARSHGA